MAQLMIKDHRREVMLTMKLKINMLKKIMKRSPSETRTWIGNKSYGYPGRGRIF